MKSTLLPIVSLCTASLCIAFSLGCHPKDEVMPDAPLENLYLRTSSESQARADKVLPNVGSEDASHILGDWKPDSEPKDYDRDEYLPEPAVEWGIDVEFPANKSIDAKRLASQFGETFREKFGSCSLYGRDSQSGFWTFLVSADGPEEVTGLKIAYDYNQTWKPDFRPAFESEYEARLSAVAELAVEYIGDCNTTPSKSPAEAAKHAKTLTGLSEKYDRTAAIHLVAEKGKHFEGRDIWDVMQCLGLQWGDMDCFHWVNEGGAGDDYFFSVETSTPPGYFLPEQIAAGQLQTGDLIFICSVPRTCQPVEVIRRMDKAVRYCQRRLGGSVHYTLGESELLMPVLLENVEQIASDLAELGFEPGTGPALRMF
ncbi:cell division protein ZipA C-terminal FtsZ-binding domain-containing protein [Novipirellula rosea]